MHCCIKVFWISNAILKVANVVFILRIRGTKTVSEREQLWFKFPGREAAQKDNRPTFAVYESNQELNFIGYNSCQTIIKGNNSNGFITVKALFHHSGLATTIPTKKIKFSVLRKDFGSLWRRWGPNSLLDFSGLPQNHIMNIRNNFGCEIIKQKL